MKNKLFLFSVICAYFLLAGLLFGCYPIGQDAPAPVNRSNYSATVVSRETLEKSITLSSPQPLKDAGKIYLYGNYILINEKYKGLHIVDNTDVRNPKKIAFLGIAGNLDMAVYQQKLYVDNAVDLVTIDFQELLNGKLKVLSRLKNNLPSVPSPDGMRYTYNTNGIVTAWRK